jgi:hypothetical protein
MLPLLSPPLVSTAPRQHAGAGRPGLDIKPLKPPTLGCETA